MSLELLSQINNSQGNTPALDQLIDVLPAELRELASARGDVQPAVMFYSPVEDKTVRDAVMAEYKKQGEASFLRQIAAAHGELLMSAGLTEFALTLMHKGVLPYTEQGKPYAVNVDHVVDRAGCGSLGLTQTANGMFVVNSSGNLVLTDRDLHEDKTKLINGQTKDKEAKWVVTLAPTESASARGIALNSESRIETFEMGRPVWLFRANAMLDRAQADSSLVDTARMMWAWAQQAHEAKDPAGFHDMSGAQKETKSFLKARQSGLAVSILGPYVR